MAALKKLALAVAAAGITASGQAQVFTYTENDASCSGCKPLGYPVPIPVDSQAAVAGFRRYNSLIAGLQARALGNADLREVQLGSTRASRTILAFVAGDADSSTAEGLIPEAAVLQNGGIHAREWGTPEVVAGILERLDDNAGSNGLHRYLLDNLTMVTIPVLNVDGFLQTQRFPDTTLKSEHLPDQADPNYPRDGRMRRKNMLNTDQVLDRNADGMNGVDLNRNNPPIWARSNRSSGDPRSIVYHGSSAASEPETQALHSAANLGPASRLRLYIDTHSFSQIYFAPYTNVNRRNRIQDRLAQVMRTVPGADYRYGPGGPGGEIGSTDEYFAYTYQVPSYTLELEPLNGGQDYGGTGLSHSGFVLPAAEVSRVREEMAQASLLGYYHQAGPPTLIGATLTNTDADQVVLESNWAPVSANARTQSSTRPQALVAGANYRLQLRFNKPMRHRAVGGNIANYPGQSVALAPAIRLLGQAPSGTTEQSLSTTTAGWQNGAGEFLRYADDSFQVDFTLAGGFDPAQLTLLSIEVDVTDMAGLALDADPRSVVDWAGGAWSQYENGAGVDADAGGPDRFMRVIDDGSPPIASGSNGGGGGGGYLPLLSLSWLLLMAGLRGRRSAELTARRG